MVGPPFAEKVLSTSRYRLSHVAARSAKNAAESGLLSATRWTSRPTASAAAATESATPSVTQTGSGSCLPGGTRFAR